MRMVQAAVLPALTVQRNGSPGGTGVAVVAYFSVAGAASAPSTTANSGCSSLP
jgi:hypothetical protein